MLFIHHILVFARAQAGAPVAVVQEPASLDDDKRARVACRLGKPTAFVASEVPEQLPAIQFDPGTGIPQGAVPAAFFDAHGNPTEGEAACIAVFRALATQKQTMARRVLLETSAGYVSVQEEVFRKPTNAQVWMEQPLATLSPVEDTALLAALNEVLASAGPGSQAGAPTVSAWRAEAAPAPVTREAAQSVALSSGPPLCLIELPDLAALERLSALTMLPQVAVDIGIDHFLFYTRSTGSPFTDLAVRHLVRLHSVAQSTQMEERPASLWSNAALGCLLYRQGVEKTYFVVDQGAPERPRCRLSVWLEVDTGQPTRVSVGGPVAHLSSEEVSLESLLT